MSEISAYKAGVVAERERILRDVEAWLESPVIDLIDVINGEE